MSRIAGRHERGVTSMTTCARYSPAFHVAAHIRATAGRHYNSRAWRLDSRRQSSQGGEFLPRDDDERVSRDTFSPLIFYRLTARFYNVDYLIITSQP